MSTSIEECSLKTCECCGETQVHPFTDICYECGHEEGKWVETTHGVLGQLTSALIVTGGVSKEGADKEHTSVSNIRKSTTYSG